MLYIDKKLKKEYNKVLIIVHDNQLGEPTMKCRKLALFALLGLVLIFWGCTATRYNRDDPEANDKETFFYIENVSDYPIFVGLGKSSVNYIDDGDRWPMKPKKSAVWNFEFYELEPDSATVLRDVRRRTETIYIRWWQEDFSRWSKEFTIKVERTGLHSLPQYIKVDNALIFGRTMQNIVVLNDTEQSLEFQLSQGQKFRLEAGQDTVLDLMPGIRTVVSWTTDTRPVNFKKMEEAFILDEEPDTFFNGHWYGGMIRITDPGRY